MSKANKPVLVSLLFLTLWGCVKKKKPGIKGVRGGVKIENVKEIQSGKFGFKNARYAETSGVFVFTDESSRKLFVAKDSANVNNYFNGQIKEIFVKDSTGIFFVNKVASIPPLFELYFSSFNSNVPKKLFTSNSPLTNFQFAGNSDLIFFENGKPIKADEKKGEAEPVKNPATLGFYAFKTANALKIFNRGKVRIFNFPKGKRIVWFESNFKTKTAVAYVATEGTFLFKEGKKIKIGNFENPTIDFNGNLIAGVKGYYGNNRLLKSELILYDISTGKTIGVPLKSKNYFTEIHWSTKGNFLVGSDVAGNIILMKIKT